MVSSDLTTLARIFRQPVLDALAYLKLGLVHAFQEAENAFGFASLFAGLGGWTEKMQNTFWGPGTMHFALLGHLRALGDAQRKFETHFFVPGKMHFGLWGHGMAECFLATAVSKMHGESSPKHFQLVLCTLATNWDRSKNVPKKYIM